MYCSGVHVSWMSVHASAERISAFKFYFVFQGYWNRCVEYVNFKLVSVSGSSVCNVKV